MDKGLFHTVGFCQEGFLDDWNLHQLTPPWQVGDKLYIIERCFDADHFLFFLKEVMFLLSNTLNIPIQIQQFYQAKLYDDTENLLKISISLSNFETVWYRFDHASSLSGPCA